MTETTPQFLVTTTREFDVAALIVAFNQALGRSKEWQPIDRGYEFPAINKSDFEVDEPSDFYYDLIPAGWPEGSKIVVRFVNHNRAFSICEAIVRAPHIEMAGCDLSDLKFRVVYLKGWLELRLRPIGFDDGTANLHEYLASTLGIPLLP